ncbi:MAG: helix-turn-helix domain-containing protein [Fimbriimonadaceae bacterium]|nr:helix-turn-helix domain-containing protein [Fimbriimonadaceae bacterium]
MNLADAIRRAQEGQNAAPTSFAAAPKQEEAPNTPTFPTPVPLTPDEQPAPPNPNVSGSVVRLELFLSAEQLGGMFRAIMAGQHTVLTMREAASYLRITTGALEKLAEDGEVPAVQIDGRWRFPKASLDDWLLAQTISTEEVEDVA